MFTISSVDPTTLLGFQPLTLVWTFTDSTLTYFSTVTPFTVGGLSERIALHKVEYHLKLRYQSFMKIQLKKFPNGAHVVFEGNEYIKEKCILRDHFCLVWADKATLPTHEFGSTSKHLNDKGEPIKSFVLYLHRDTFVEPVIADFKI